MDNTEIINQPLETQTKEVITELVEEQNTIITEEVSEEKQLPSPPASTPPLPMKPSTEQVIDIQSTDELSTIPTSIEMKSHEEITENIEIIEEKHDLQQIDIEMKTNDQSEDKLESIPEIAQNTIIPETFPIQKTPEIENKPTINDLTDNDLKHPSPTISSTEPVINELNVEETHVTSDMITDVIMDHTIEDIPSTITTVVNDDQKQVPIVQRQSLFADVIHQMLADNTPLTPPTNVPNIAHAPNVMHTEIERVDINMNDKNINQPIIHHQSSSLIMKEELTKCLNLVIEFMNRPETEPFNEPVDWQALNLPDYPIVCPIPMDLGTIRSKLEHGQYSTPYAFADEFRLVFTNAKTYNTPGSGIYVVAENLHKQFERRFPRICQQSHRHRKNMRGYENKSTFVQRQKFVQLLNEIGSEDIGRVVELIDKLCPCALSDMSNNEELEIQVYHLDGKTITDLIQFIEKIKKKRMASAASHKKMRLQ